MEGAAGNGRGVLQMSAGQVAALYVRGDSVYKSLGVDCWDAERDARLYRGPGPVVAHPPCRGWGSLRFFAKPAPGEVDLAFVAVGQVREFGGVLEHPERSVLWGAANLPAPGAIDEFGGFTLPVSQKWWGHRAEKRTFLYVCGCGIADVPDIPLVLGDAERVLFNRRGLRAGMRGFRTECGRAERERTPEAFAVWLIDLAARCAK